MFLFCDIWGINNEKSVLCSVLQSKLYIGVILESAEIPTPDDKLAVFSVSWPPHTDVTCYISYSTTLCLLTSMGNSRILGCGPRDWPQTHHPVEYLASYSHKYTHYFHMTQSHLTSTTNVTQEDVELYCMCAHTHTRCMSLRSSCQQASALRANDGIDGADVQTRLTESQPQHTINE